MTHDIRLALSKGKIQVARKLLEEYYLNEDKSQWLVDKQSEYDSLFKTVYTPEFIDEDGNVVVPEQYDYIDDCISFTDWLQEEEVIIQEAIEPTYDEEDNLLLVGQLEKTELVRPYIPKDVTSLVDSYLASSYAEIRKATYKPIEEQLDMQYKDAINGTTTWVDYITSIKTSIPKVT